MPGDRCGERLSTLARLGPLESRVVEIVWRRRAPVSVRDLQRDLSGLAYTTVMTTLDRLYKKGLLRRHKEGRAFLYSTRITPHELQQTLAQRLAGWLLGATRESARPLLSGLVDTLGEADGALLEELERMIRQRREQLRREGR
ncbi:MAG: CopY family transcriptional regulator [Acidobacteria bacterium]|nr:MAG: CopY family transcriptional regulator [Acidobacteriota bacterium]